MTVEKKKLARRGIKVIFYLYIIGIFYFVLLSERYGRDTGYDTSHVNLVYSKKSTGSGRTDIFCPPKQWSQICLEIFLHSVHLVL